MLNICEYWFTYKLALKLPFFEDEKEIMNLSKYQKEVYYLFEEYKKCTPRLIESEIKIARPTVNQILRKLEKIGLVKRIGKGRSTEYTLNK